MIIPTFARVGMVGYTGSGKTILADWMARQWLATAGAVFISDPKMDPDSVWRGWGATCHSAKQVSEAWLDGERIIRLEGVDGDENISLMDIAVATPRSRLIIDESQDLLPNDLRRAPESFRKLVNQGRIWEQGVMLLGQVYTQLPAGFRMQAHIFTSNQNEGTGRDWMRERGGSDLEIPEFHWFVSAPDREQMVMDPVDLVPALLVEKLQNPIAAPSKFRALELA